MNYKYIPIDPDAFELLLKLQEMNNESLENCLNAAINCFMCYSCNKEIHDLIDELLEEEDD